MSIWSKIKEFVGFNDPLDAYEEDDYRNLYQEDQAEEGKRPVATANANPTDDSAAQTPRRRSRQGNVIGMPSSGSINEVLVIEPRSFEEAPQIVQHLRDRKSVILNLTLMDAEQAQRSVDFVAGATFAIDGHQERVGEGIFLFTPSTVSITTEMPSQLRAAGQTFGGNFQVGPEQPRRAQG
ncbi:MAG: cell division protein SepF [Gemmatimonadaceae bacterium]|nr:cell division protein SepF [Gloeobacterales cyanobacterium ES-bin-141]